MLITQSPNLNRYVFKMCTSGQQQPFIEVTGSMSSLAQSDRDRSQRAGSGALHLPLMGWVT